jgi:hypothetical protein
VVGEEVFLEEVDGPPPSVPKAAEHLAAWQVGYDRSLDRSWLTRDQLGRRLQATRLDWKNVDTDPRMIDLWKHRHELYDRLAHLPLVLSHGDYSIGNLVAQGCDTVALDWATGGWEPVGFDLAHLALSTGEDPTGAYLAATPLSHPPEVVTFGFAAALVIIGPAGCTGCCLRASTSRSGTSSMCASVIRLSETFVRETAAAGNQEFCRRGVGRARMH